MKCSNCNGARWVLDPEWRWWKFWVSPYTLCPECHGLNPPPNQLDDDINRWEAAFDAEERHEAMRDEPEEFQWVWDAMYDAILNQTQYSETIGLETPFEGVFISDTASGVCMSALQVELKRWEPILEQWSGNLDRIGKKCCDPMERSIEPLPAYRDAVPKPYAGYTRECGTLKPEGEAE